MSNDQQVRIYNPSEEMVKNAAVSGMDGYRALCKEAEDDYEGFWGRRAKEMLDWKVPFTKVLDDTNAPFFKWFADGKLNVSYNCLDRNVNNGLGDKVALIFEADNGEVTRITYKGPAGPRQQVRQCPAWHGRQEGRPRRHLPADVDRRRRRHAGLRPYRRHPLHRLRRLLGPGPA